jgi:hypothetical protein
MKIFRRNLHGDDAQIAPDVTVDRRTQTLRRPLAFQSDARHLSFGVHARVRAPRAVQSDRLTFEQRERALQLALHRALALRLHLPAREVSAVILDGQAENHERREP